MAGRKPYGAPGLFALAYMIVWAVFGMAATWVQWGLNRAALMLPAAAAGSIALAGVLCLLTGLYQLTR